MWTDDQAKAISICDKNLLVSAAAGSGKTAVLVERIIQMILNGVCDIDRMLVVTFTNAAAAEMRSRIHAALAEKMSASTDQGVLNRLERQSILLSGASITTIHAFCQMLLRRHFSKLELDPKFRVADEHELNIFQQEIVADVFERRYDLADPDARHAFQRFTDEYGGNERGDATLHSLVLDLYATAQSHPDPDAWLRSLPSAFDIPKDAAIDQIFWYDEAVAQIHFELDAAFDECIILHQLAIDKNISVPALDRDLEFLCDLKRAFNAGWQRLDELLNTGKFTTISFPKGTDEQLRQRFREIRDGSYKARIKNLKQDYFFAPPDRLLEDLREVHPTIEALVEVTLDFSMSYAAAKRERCIIDFHDMEHFALKILSDKSLCASLRRRYRTVMIDEYQDTNAVQEAILQSIVDDKNLFVVGDVKQSIYRFRLADPTLFMRKYDEYPHDPDCERIELSMNFRSRKQVIDAVNFVFERLMRKEAVEIEYTEDARLNCGFDYPYSRDPLLNTPTELILVTTNKDEDAIDDLNEPTPVDVLKTNADFEIGESASGRGKATKTELETQMIARRIHAMFRANIHVYDKDLKGYRKLQYRDIVILLRSAARVTGEILDVLKRNKIPAYSAEEETYFRATEIQVMVSMLNVLDNARQDVPMAAVLLSPIGCFTAEQLAQLKLISPYDDFITLLTTAAAGIKGITPELSSKAREFLLSLNRWRDLSLNMSVPELLSTIYRETKYYEAVGTMSDGMQRQANLRMLIDRAAAYEQTSFRGLSRFLQFIKKIRELNNDLKSARTLGENENVVRVMTIHKSKGLEFPIVFVAGMGNGFNFKDEKSSPLLKHRELGAGPYRMLKHSTVKVPTLARKVIGKRGINEQIAEELRILYVAMTRAREMLILVGSIKVKDLNKYDHFQGFEKLKSFAVLDARSFLDWIMLSLSQPTKCIKTYKISADKIVIGNLEPLTSDQPSVDQPVEVKAEELKAGLNIPAKMSVTELKRRFTEDETAVKVLREEKFYRRPNFEQAKRMTGLEYGLAMHSVMQHLDLHGDLSSGGIDDQIGSMVERKILTSDAARAIRREDVAAFFDGEFGRRLIRAEHVWRELPFNMLLSTKDLNVLLERMKSEYLSVQTLPASDDKIFIQGIIDVLFKDERGLVLLDYKTDRVDDIELIRQKYRLQIDLYASAVESILGTTVDEKFIFLLSQDTLISV